MLVVIFSSDPSLSWEGTGTDLAGFLDLSGARRHKQEGQWEVSAFCLRLLREEGGQVLPDSFPRCSQHYILHHCLILLIWFWKQDLAILGEICLTWKSGWCDVPRVHRSTPRYGNEVSLFRESWLKDLYNFTAALCLIAPAWDQPKGFIIRLMIDEIWYVYKMAFYSTIKRSTLIQAATRLALDCKDMLSKRTQTPENTSSVVTGHNLCWQGTSVVPQDLGWEERMVTDENVQ